MVARVVVVVARVGVVGVVVRSVVVGERKSVVWGKRVDLGGRRIIKNNTIDRDPHVSQRIDDRDRRQARAGRLIRCVPALLGQDSEFEFSSAFQVRPRVGGTILVCRDADTRSIASRFAVARRRRT